MIRTPVLISGAGPTGLTLALALSRRGVASLLVDQTLDPVTTTPIEGLPFSPSDLTADPNITLRFGWRLFGFERFEDKVTIHIHEVAGDRQAQVHADFLVGCDGADSRVRNFLDIDVSDGKVAKTFGRGRVLLAGDAAHPVSAGDRNGLALSVGDALHLSEAIGAWLATPSAAPGPAAYERERRAAGQF